MSQTRIDAHYITYHDNTRFAKIASDRLRDAVVKITGKDTDLSLGAAPLPKRQKKRKIEQRVDQADIDPQGDWMDEAQQYQAQP